MLIFYYDIETNETVMHREAKTKEIDLGAPEYYFNRELSLLEFNKRVLKEASDKSHPLLERLKFSSIFSSNLDEFFMIRVAGLKSQISAGVMELSYNGMTPKEQLQEIRKRLVPMYAEQERILMDDVFPELEKHDINIHNFDDLQPAEKEFLSGHFDESIMPVLTPLSLDPAHPFPRLINRSLNIAFVLSDKVKGGVEKRIAFLQIPAVLPRFVRLENKKGNHFVLLEQIIKEYADMLFPGLTVDTANTFRVTRDADVEIAEDEAEDLLSEIAEQIKSRRWGRAVVRLEVSSNMPDYLVNLLMNALELEPNDVYVHNRPLNMPDFMELSSLGIRNISDIPFKTRVLPELSIDGVSTFDAIKKKDLLVHHPFDSFSNSTLKFINEASNDKDVLAIKVTLYRTGKDSLIVRALKNATENGKDVTAFVELKARFDEEKNIDWARELEQAGVHVVYGVMGLKTHCKIAMVVRREKEKLKTYLHLSTGNYNHVTARLYTDIGLFTAKEDYGREAMYLFNYLTGYSHHKDWNKFIVSPVNLRETVVKLINREAELHTPENPGLIIVKMNSLAHKQVIQSLYRASQKGVTIKMNVRGLCCLKPGVKGVSDNIEVRSILGRFLEHSRVFYFKNGGDEKIFLSSADWMTRNLHRRVELMFEIESKELKKSLLKLLKLYWKDNTKSWRLLPNGNYKRISPAANEKPFAVQEHFLNELRIHG